MELEMELEQRIAQLPAAKLALLEKMLQADRPQDRALRMVGAPPVSEAAAPTASAPLSFAQERLWFLSQMEPDTSIYNLPAVIGVPAGARADLVEKALLQVVARHGALRTHFLVDDDAPRQVVDDDPKRTLDFAACTARSERELGEIINAEMWKPFDLARGAVLRARLIRRNGGESILLLVTHHIVSDGWSINVLLREFRTLYTAIASGAAPALGPAPLQYADHAIAERRSLQGARLEDLLRYWRGQLEGVPPLINLPLDHRRPPRQSYRGSLHSFRLPAASLRGLKKLARDASAAPFMVLLAAFNVLLHRYTQQERIAVGTPIANRARSEREGAIGLFANTLVLCTSLGPDITFRELVAQVRDTTLQAYAHQDLPFEKLVLDLQPERSLSYNPLFQVMFILQNLPGAGPMPSAPAPAADAIPFDAKFSKFDLTLALSEDDAGFSGVIEYASDLFEAGTIERMAVHFENLVRQMLRNPDAPVGSFSFLAPDEQRRLIVEWNDTAQAWPEFLPLHARFEQQARATPHAPAVTFRDSRLRYGEFDRRAERVAALLRRRGVARGEIVGVCAERGLEMVVALYAILKAGAAYMPIDPEFPAARIGYMLQKAEARYVLTSDGTLHALAGQDVEPIVLGEDGVAHIDAGEDESELPPVAVGPDDPAYVIFTSGSTGRPKGVVVSHGAIHNRLRWMQQAYPLTSDDRVMQKTPFTFDVSVWEFFWPLAEGACLVVAEPHRHKESGYLVDLVQAEDITCLHFVPTMLELFLSEDLSGCTSLRRIICSGEALTIEQCERLNALPGVRAHNLYGPTEAAVDVTHWDCAAWRGQYLSIPIGRPIANTQIYILNESLQPAPIGVAGELYIGGANLAKGYLGDPDLTRSRFIPSPFATASDARLYRTGDLARFRADGVIEYLGRIDTQVKLRGTRIELGEIESILRGCPGVQEAAVIVYDAGAHDQRLAAYVVPQDPERPPATETLLVALEQALPNYMIPTSIMALPKLPVTANGKLDHRSLPVPVPSRGSGADSDQANAIEREMLEIWSKYLKIGSLSAEDDFFAMGGHSILATQLVNALGAHFHLNIPVRLLFEHPTVRRLTTALGALDEQAWREDPEASAAISGRSLLRVRQRLADMPAAELDRFLEEEFAAGRLAEFETIEALLAWSCTGASADVRPREALPASPASAPPAPLDLDPYFRCCLELGRVRLELGWLAANGAMAATERADRIEILRAQADAALRAYARSVRGAFASAGDRLSPAELVTWCQQVVAVSALHPGAGHGPYQEGR